ncbi:hypothetical protein Q3G72_033272 [Acer saccharum]|nr:hypothetical protein Q3G72_033272 [Acer saccharum]
MQLFSERIINLWNKCEVRAIILLSLVLQIILIILGNRRKWTARFWIRIIVWSAYLSADWVATVALGNLASSIGDSEDSTPAPNNALQEFWAPFLLLHLGGPDTITAYSLEDNELWLRHFLVLIIQVGVAFYVFLRSWGNTALTFLTIPIFISGVIKYGERTYTLMSSSSEHFKDFLPSSPDSCQDFVKYTRGERVEESGESEEETVIPQDGIHTEDHYLALDMSGGREEEEKEAMVIPQDGIHKEDMVIPRGKRAEGGSSSEEEARVIPQDGIHKEDMIIPRGKRAEGATSSSEEARVIPQDDIHTEDMVIPRGKRAEGATSSSSEEEEEEEARIIPQDGIDTEDHYLVLAYYLFIRTKFFFAERTLNTNEQKHIYSIIKNKPTAEAFKLVAVELGFMYDMLYTKAAIVYSHLGIVFRCITFFSSVCSLVVFSTIIDTRVYPITDISISYLLLVGAVLLELYALIILLLSDSAKLWLIKLKNAQHNPVSKTVVDLFWRFSGHSQSLLTSRKRWSESMGQYSLIGSCLKDMQLGCFGVQKLPFIGKLLERKYLTWIDVNTDHHLQEKILQYLQEQGNTVNKDDVSYYERDLFLTRRGSSVINERYNSVVGDKEISWSITVVEFVESLIIWHIATDMCYYCDLHDQNIGGGFRNLDPECKIGKCLSDYMCYLLAFYPSMLPKGIAEVRYKETCVEVTTLFKQKRDDRRTAYVALRQKYEEEIKTSNDSWKEEVFLMKESQSVLKQGCCLYMLLQQTVGHDNYQKKWEIISDVWVEMLVYAAHSCEWKEHAQQLRKGGELLTHVSLLVAHFGLSKQYFHNVLTQIIPKKPREP